RRTSFVAVDARVPADFASRKMGDELPSISTPSEPKRRPIRHPIACWEKASAFARSSPSMFTSSSMVYSAFLKCGDDNMQREETMTKLLRTTVAAAAVAFAGLAATQVAAGPLADSAGLRAALGAVEITDKAQYTY